MIRYTSEAPGNSYLESVKWNEKKNICKKNYKLIKKFGCGRCYFIKIENYAS
jgi:hypothetical protein